ncbi:MAG TPA: ABC transporter permease [Flavihumibacter sp.]|nr:ABC transporter permease [Flavihumibacter sp.]
MLLNYLKIAWRNLQKHRFLSVLNIVGLSVGICCFLLIALYISNELSYDKYHVNNDRIYRINADLVFGGTSLSMAVTPDPMGAVLKKDYPEVEQFTRIYTSSGSKLIRKGNNFITENAVAHVDSSFFDVFSFVSLQGDLQHALTAPNAVVITETAARKYFGSTAALGQVIETTDQGKTDYKVTAVIKDMPQNGHFHFDFLFSMQNVNYPFGTYLSHNFSTYLLLQKGTDPRAFEKHFPDYIKRYVIAEASQGMNIKSLQEFEAGGNRISYTLIPITSIHLHSNRMVELGVNSNSQYVTIFSAIAFFILLIACINFMNLSTARSATRAREVGIRKVLGSEKQMLVKQFLSESLLITLISTTVALFLAWASLPAFNQLAGKSFRFIDFMGTGFWPFLLLLPVVVGLLAGLYPSFYLSSFQPITVLKGKFKSANNTSRLRSALVVFQFATSIVLVIGTLVVYRQLNYISHKDVGFNKEQVLIIQGAGALNERYNSFNQELEKVTGVVSTASASFLPVMPSHRSDQTFSTSPVINNRNAFNMQRWKIDENYISTLGMQMAAGRNFSKAYKTDSTAIILNESAVKLLALKNPIGSLLYDYKDSKDLVPRTIIGVVKDFHFSSLRDEIGPLAFVLGDKHWNTAVRVGSNHAKQVVDAAEKIWKNMSTGLPFSYAFLDESFNNMYQAEQRVGKIIMSFSILAVFIACLGLFGLASFMAEQRTKEIGVRKVLGASVNNIVQMLSKDFLLLVLVASCIAIPLAWFFMHRWLQDFAYRVQIPLWIFAAATFLALLIALLTVSLQALKAALANPVKSLRSE